MAELVDRLRNALAERYLIERELGRGGMAIVYLAEDLKHQRRVALKVLRPELAASIGAERFLREITTAAQLTHPNILPLFDSGEADGTLYYTMPYVEGESLRDRLNREKQLPIDDALQITREVADALGYAHEQGIVHRDIKPENILFQRGHALVADFGIARAVTAAGAETLTETGLAVGTPAYMSPEQGAGAGKVDGRSDLYSLGCVLYEMLSGETPYTGPTPQAILAKKLTEPLPRITTVRETVPGPVEAALTKALAKAPADRYVTAEQFTQALSADVQSYERQQRRRALLRRVAIAAASLVVIGGGTYGALRQRAATSWQRMELDPDAVAVMPFRVTATDSVLQGLAQGMPDLLWNMLPGDVGPRAVDPNPLIRAWNQVSSSDGDAQDVFLRLAARFGAGQLLEGSVVQVGPQLTLNAWLHRVPGNDELASHSVTGSVDSLTVLAGRLVLGLLGDQLGEGARLFNLERHSEPAWREYLAGREAKRNGLPDEAARHLERALELDSTFAEAALELVGMSDRVGFRGTALAKPLRGSLSARDQALLDFAVLYYRIDTTGTLAEILPATRRLLAVAPDDATSWLIHAIFLIMGGRTLPIAEWQEQVQAAVEQAWSRDSTTTSVLLLMADCAAYLDDTELLHRVVRRYRAVGDTLNPGWPAFEWHLAQRLGDSAAVRRFRGRAQARDTSVAHPTVAFKLMNYNVHHGLALADPWLVLNRARVYDATTPLLFFPQSIGANAAGRVRDAIALHSPGGPVCGDCRGSDCEQCWRTLIDWWFAYPGFDSVAAAVRDSLVASLAGDRQNLGFREHFGSRPEAFEAACYVLLYDVAQGDTVGARRAAQELESRYRQEHWLGLCPALVLALVESQAPQGPEAPALERLEALLRQGMPWELPVHTGMLMVARLRRQRGEYGHALAAARSQLQHAAADWESRTAYLKEEGDLAVIVGDTASAINAYRQYVTLKSDPDPGPAAEERAQVRAALERLLRARR